MQLNFFSDISPVQNNLAYLFTRTNTLTHKPSFTSLYKNSPGHLILLHGPLHWFAGRQISTAQSTAEAEIYSTNECARDFMNLRHIISDLNLSDTLAPGPTPIYNDNMACVHWCHNKSNRSMRHIQIRENLVRETIQNDTVSVTHVRGKINPADLLTKEQKDTTHFIQLRNFILSPPPVMSTSVH